MHYSPVPNDLESDLGMGLYHTSTVTSSLVMLHTTPALAVIEFHSLHKLRHQPAQETRRLSFITSSAWEMET